MIVQAYVLMTRDDREYVAVSPYVRAPALLTEITIEYYRDTYVPLDGWVYIEGTGWRAPLKIIMSKREKLPLSCRFLLDMPLKSGAARIKIEMENLRRKTISQSYARASLAYLRM